MNDKKLKQLFAAARRETSPVPPGDFATEVLRVVRRLPVDGPPAPPGVFEQLNGWFPRVAFASLALIVLCVVADNWLAPVNPPDAGDTAAQFSSQYFAPTEDL